MQSYTDLESQIFDALVIGGGIHGATALNELSRAGYTSALIEMGDFGSATSSNSLKIIHGGLRYLQHGNIKRMRQSILSRRKIAQMAPHLVCPLSCVMPTEKKLLRSKAVMKIAMFLNDLIGWDRNKDIDPALFLPKGKTLSREQCANILQGAYDASTMTGAALWYDVLALNTERIILEYILNAVEQGATVHNYCRAESIEKTDDYYSIIVKDQNSQEIHTIRSRCVINAAGPWFEKDLQKSSSPRQTQKWAIAVNLVSKRQLFQNHAVALEGITEFKDSDSLLQNGKRLYFFVPWRNYTMIGTEYFLQQERTEQPNISRELIESLVSDINSINPSANLHLSDISFYHAGLMPVQDSSTIANVQLVKESSIQQHTEAGFDRVLSIKSVKFTTAPVVAMDVVSHVQEKFSTISPHTSSQQAQRPLTQNSIPAVYSFLLKRYGKRADNILSFMQEDEEPYLIETLQLLRAEIRYFIQQEYACHLEDVLLRRTGIGTAEYPGDETVQTIALFMGKILNWNEQQREQEIEKIKARYCSLEMC